MIYRCDGDGAGFDGRGEILGVGSARHLHIYAGVNCSNGGVLGAGAEAMGGEVLDCLPIADDHPAEAPLSAQNVMQKEAVAGSGYAVQVHVRRH